MLINGQRVDAASGSSFPVRNPATGAIIDTVPQAGPEDVHAAIEVALRGKAAMAAGPARLHRPVGLPGAPAEGEGSAAGAIRPFERLCASGAWMPIWISSAGTPLISDCKHLFWTAVIHPFYGSGISSATGCPAGSGS
jgi:hypothetical protein